MPKFTNIHIKVSILKAHMKNFASFGAGKKKTGSPVASLRHISGSAETGAGSGRLVSPAVGVEGTVQEEDGKGNGSKQRTMPQRINSVKEVRTSSGWS